MRSPFVRFTVAFVAIVVCAAALWFYFARFRLRSSNLPAEKPSPVSAPQAPSPAPAQPATGRQVELPDNPPDINGLNYTEVAIPGSTLTAEPPAASTGSASTAAASGDYVAEILARKLVLPIENVRPNEITDTFNESRGASKHEATDIMAPRGTPVYAIGEGNIAKLFLSKRGGLTIYEFDDQQKYCYYYAHLDRYANGIKEGMLVRPGDLIGYVGSTGDADVNAPHLHFAISLLNPDKHYWQGTALNPYPVLEKLAQAGHGG